MLVKSMYGPEAAAYIGQLHCVTMTCGELGGALFHTSNNDLRMAVHSDDFVCVCPTMMDSNTSTNPNTQRKTVRHWDSKHQT